MDILVVSGCSGEKYFEDSPIGWAEIDSANREELVGEYPKFVTRRPTCTPDQNTATFGKR